MKNYQKFGLGLICLAVLITTATIAAADFLGSHQDQRSQMNPTSNQQSENPAAGTTVTMNSPVPLKTVQRGLSPNSSTPFITIDPISDKTTGDLIIISGTTNLPAQTSIYLKDINESTGKSTMTANTIACPNATGVNRWTFTLDPTTWMRPGSYRYMVSTPSEDVNSSVHFNLKGTFVGPENILYYQDSKESTLSGTGAPYITVNPIGDRQKGDIFLISGSTNLAEGTRLYGTVWPVYYEDTSKKPSIISNDFCDGQYNMIGYPTAVVKETGDTNRWSFPADMTIFPEKTGMIVHVSTANEDFTERDIYGNSTFNLT